MGTLLVFYSYPEESSLTAIFRGIEVCKPNKVVIMTSHRRCDDVRTLIDKLRKYYEGESIEFLDYCSIPDVETSLSQIPSVIDRLRPLIKELEDDVYVVASAGSRLELASLSMIIDRSRTEVLYISFLFGPWSGTYYPYTPKPLQIVHEIHPLGKELIPGPYPRIRSHGELLQQTTSLRKAVLSTQYTINQLISDSRCIGTTDGIECSCRGMDIRIFSGGVPKLDIHINDYCSYDEVVDKVIELLERGKI